MYVEKGGKGICQSHEFSKDSHDETFLTTTQPTFLAANKKALTLTYSNVTLKKFRGVPTDPPGGRGGGKEGKREEGEGKGIKKMGQKGVQAILFFTL